MSTNRIPLREAFAPGAWDRACVDAARRHIAGWRAELADGSALCVDAISESRGTVCIRGRGPAVLRLALDEPAIWWPTAPGWETSEWRDVLLLQALEPVLAGLSHWLPAGGPWQCDWCAAAAPAAQPWALGLRWCVGDEERRLSLHWPSAGEAVSQWAAHGMVHGDGNEDGDEDGDEGDDGMVGDEPATEARLCVAALHLSTSELIALQPGGGLVLGELAASDMPLWLRAGTRWLVAAPECGSHADDEMAPDETLPAVPEDGALWVLSEPVRVRPRDLAHPRLQPLAAVGQGCTLWWQGRPAGQGRLLEHEGLTVVRITDWQA